MLLQFQMVYHLVQLRVVTSKSLPNQYFAPTVSKNIL